MLNPKYNNVIIVTIKSQKPVQPKHDTAERERERNKEEKKVQ